MFSVLNWRVTTGGTNIQEEQIYSKVHYTTDRRVKIVAYSKRDIYNALQIN